MRERVLELFLAFAVHLRVRVNIFMSISPERRRWQRLPLRIPVFVLPRHSKASASMEFAAALNISAGGALLHTRSFFPVNSVVTLRVPLSPVLGSEHRDQQIEARVVRFEPRDQGFNLAVEFAEALITRNTDMAAVPLPM